MAEQIPGAQFVELPGGPHFPMLGDWRSVVDEIERFLVDVRVRGEWDVPEPERMLATVLFTDIVSASQQAARLGDRAWRDLLERHHQLIRHELVRFRGREVDTAGDGFFASFDGPARAIRCAAQLSRRSRRSVLKFVPDCIPANANSSTARWPASPSTQVLA